MQVSEEYLRFEQDSLQQKIASGRVLDLFARNNMQMDEVHAHLVVVVISFVATVAYIYIYI